MKHKVRDINAPSRWNMRIWDDDKKEWLCQSDDDALTYYGFDITGGETTEFQGLPKWHPDRHLIWEQSVGLKDKNGKEIYEGDILRFDDDNGIWQAPVVFERGLFGLDVYHPKQIKNPDGWDKEYDKVDTRWWSTVWGYEEFGTAFTYRTPLAKATIFNGSPEEYEKSEQKKLHKKFGYGDYFVMAEVIGNIHENPELLGDNEYGR